MKDIINNPKKRRMLSTLFKMIVLVATLSVASYSWFLGFKTSSIDGIEFDTIAVNDVEISLDGGETWKGTIDLNIGSDFTFRNLATSNGIDFYYANQKDDDGTPISFAEAISGKDYLEYEMLLSSQVTSGVFLETTASVEPVAGTTAAYLFGQDVTRKSAYGEFSKDLIAGSIRVAIIENDYVGGEYVPQDETKIVWAPNKNYEISCASNECSASITSTNSQNYNYVKVTNSTTFVEERVPNIKDVILASTTTKDANGDPMLFYCPGKEIKSMTIRIWVEGNDRDAVTAVKGGQFKIVLRFVSIEKALNETPPAVTADQMNNTLIGFESTMEYSIDYGNNWISYATNSNPTFSEGATVYVRTRETAAAFASDYVTLEY